MKVPVYITMLLIVGVMFFIVIQMINEAEVQYDVSINKSFLVDSSDTTNTSRYDFAGRINNSVWNMGQDFLTLSNEDEGWLTRISSGFTGIVRAVIFLPVILFFSVVMGNNLIIGLGTFLGVPGYLLLVFGIMLYIWAIFTLLKFFQRWDV